MRRKRRDDYLDSRITERAIDSFRLAKAMLAQGFASDSREVNEVSLAIHRELGLRPWQPFVLDLEIFDMTPPSPPNADWQLVQELHRRLVAAAAV
jgi:hypothetical protein